MPLNKRQLNKKLKDKYSDFRIDKILETVDDKRGTNYLCLKLTKIKVKAKKFKETVEHLNYNLLEDEEEEKCKIESDIYLKIPQDFFDDKSHFRGLYKIEAKPLNKRYRKGKKPIFHLWAESFPSFSFEIDLLRIPSTTNIVSGRNNPYDHYAKFKSIASFIPSIRFGIYGPYLVSNSKQRIDEGDEFQIIFYDYVVILTDDVKGTIYALFSRF
jgi:hypothetical protein